MKAVMLLGASGLVGSFILRQLFAADNVGRVIAPTRTPLQGNTKAANPVVPDLLDLLEMDVWTPVDAVICVLGTTRQAAGSDEAFRRIDRDLPLKLARKARDMGVPVFGYVSSLGADPRSRFLYARTKGEVELGLNEMKFPSLTIIRPSLISGDRPQSRLRERATLGLLHILAPLLPTSVRPNRAESIASTLVNRALNPRAGHTVIRSQDLD
jgi:uncharacterized protein YbjT (DUF2867 family)